MRKRFFFKLMVQSAGIATLSLVLAVVLFHFIFQPFQVAGLSMAPTLDDCDYLLVDRVFYNLEPLGRGDIVVFRSPADQRFLVKRIAALAGDRVCVCTDGTVLVNEAPLAAGEKASRAIAREVVVPDGDLYLLGDNAPLSQDSRSFGPVPIGSVHGRVFMRYFPPRAIPDPALPKALP